MAISRKGNVGNEHAPASSPAVAHRRAKRTEWRMRGREPNKNVTSFSPHPSCLRDASAIHLPARSIAASPLWLKTVTCGLFLRCFTPPRRAPSGEGLTGCLHSCHSGALVEKSHTIETARCIYALAHLPARGLPAEKSHTIETARYVPAPAKCPQRLPALPARAPRPTAAHRLTQG